MEAKKLAYADLFRYNADPDFVAVPLDMLLSKAHAESLCGKVDPEHASATGPTSTADAGGDTIVLSAADDDGKFKLRGIAPGRYEIFAVEKMAADSFRNPEAADQLDQFGELIDVPEGATLEAHPRLIPADRAAKAIE